MIYDVIIIGGGFSGLTAGIYSVRNGLKTALFEQSVFGGQIFNTNSVENYPCLEKISGYELSSKLTLQAKNSGVMLKNEKVISVNLLTKNKIVKTQNGEFYAKSVIIATGSSPKKAGFTGEEEFTSKGVSYCYICDGPIYKDREVFVVGGGHSAVQACLYLSSIASKVNLVVRSNALRCPKNFENNLLSKNNVEILYETNVSRVGGEEYLDTVELKDKKKENNIIKKSSSQPYGVFVLVGHKPNSELFEKYVNVNPEGYIIANESCKTNINGVFVCGDVRTKNIRQLVTATSDGATAAIEAGKYVSSVY